MRRWILWLVVLNVMIVPKSLWADTIPSGDFYVSLSGDDNNDGSIGSPFATIGRAKTAVAALVSGGLTDDVLVYIRGGDYLLDTAITFGAADSGTADHSITYKAYPGEEVHIIGGTQLDPSWFSPVTDPTIISRLPSGMDAYVQVADLSSHGITNYGTLNLRGFSWDNEPGALELFLNGQVMQLSRWPNTGWENVAGIPAGKYDKQFTYSGSEPDRWTTAPDAWVWGDFSVYWADAFISVVSVDPATNTITLSDKGYDGIEFRSGFTPIWYGLNLLEEIDSPGEWYLDRSSGKLYFYPPGSLAGQDIFVSMINTLITCNSASYLNFEGLIFEISRHWLVDVDSGCNHVRFYQCTFRNAGTDAADIDGWNTGLDSCAVYDCGDAGINLRGGERYPIDPANNYVTNSHIHDLNRWVQTYNPAIYTRKDCGVTVSHNLIHDLSAIACMYSRSNDIKIKYNEIYNVCKMADDNGALYSQWDWAARDIEIENNFIHHVNSLLGGEGVHGVYLDTGGSANLIQKNIFYDIDRRAIMIGGGRDNEIYNNIIAKCGTAIMIDQRLVDPGANIARMYDYLDDFLTGNPNWQTYGPEYAGIDQIPSDSPELPLHNQVRRNIAYDYDLKVNFYNVFWQQYWTECGFWGWLGYGAPANPPRDYLVQSDNLVGDPMASSGPLGVDPCFVDEANLNMNLDPSSPAYTIPGWEDIPFDQIGLEPTAPVVYVTVDGCSGSNYIISGQCDPWATIQSATILQNAQDIASYLTVADNGAISGTIPRSSVSTGAVTVEIVTVDPKGHESPVGTSNTWADADVDDDCSVDISDYADLLGDWLSPCSGPGWCDGADINQDGIVNLDDVSLLFLFWNDTLY